MMMATKGFADEKRGVIQLNEQNYLCFYEYWFKLTVCSGLD